MREYERPPPFAWANVGSIRLVSHLHAECLLDRTALLEWYLSFLEASSVDRLPLVYTLATVFWDDIMGLRKLARRFSNILLAKSEQVRIKAWNKHSQANVYSYALTMHIT